MFQKIIEEDIKDIISETAGEINKLEGSKVLVTGASGMLASYIVYTLLYANKFIFKKPVDIYLLVRTSDRKFGFHPNLFYVLCDIAVAKPNLADINYIIHAASKAAPKLYKENMIDTLNTNILGLYNLLSLCNNKTKSILYFSSAEVYGSPKKEKPVDENYRGVTDHLSTRSCYVEAKRICETICMNYFWEKNFPVKIARIFHTFGPGLNIDDGRVFSDFIKFGLEKKDITIFGDHALKRSILYIKDATIMFFKILISKKNGEVYNIGNNKNTVSIEEFANIVCRAYNNYYDSKIDVVIKRDKHKTYYKDAAKNIQPNINKFIHEFTYIPTTDIATCVSRTVEYLLNKNIKSS